MKLALLIICCLNIINAIRLPEEHYEYYAKNNATFYHNLCSSDQQVVYDFICNRSIDELRCWGYEDNISCRKWSNKYHVKPVCFKKFSNHDDLTKNKKIFYDEADFGYLEKKRKELKIYCKPLNKFNLSHSSLQCSDYLRFCEAKNIYIDFKKLVKFQGPLGYRTDVLDDGDVGGFECKLNKNLLLKQRDHKSPLQSWFEELEHFTVLNNSSTDQKCDLTINKTVYIMKLDATVCIINMYHHFCDFINLYVSLHMTNDFSLDKLILIWNTYYRDPSNFAFTWKAFTKHPLLNLDEFRGKNVCFKHAIFTFLPRMIYGLYYNMPLIRGCKRSGLFHAFNRHLLNGLDILKNYNQLLLNPNEITNQMINNQKKNKLVSDIQITFLSRTTPYRKVLNEDELIEEIRKNSSSYRIIKVDFNHSMPFEEQLKISSKTDILIGLHGAGLTHLLFLPDWAVLFELYNCGDEDCYKDLARLRGLKYITWKNEKKLKYIKNVDRNKPAHLKFTDYYFDKNEFMTILNLALKYVKNKKWIFYKKQFEKLKKDEIDSKFNDSIAKNLNFVKNEL